ncbi:unnamed protein product, partial [Adineta steineri]
MASNNMSSKWSVRITSFPPSMDSAKLAQEFRLPRTLRVSIPKTFNNNNNPCAWINGFVNEEDANEFVQQWSGASIQGQKIKCTVSSRSNDQTSRTQFASKIEPLANQPCDSRPSSTEPKLTRNLTKNQVNEAKRFLCRYANKGTCREKSSECKYRHQRCINYESCKDLKCELAHTKPDLGRVRSDSCSSTNSFQSISSTLSTNRTTRGQCRNGIKCFNVDCTFDHPDGWNPCIDGEQCDDYDCTANHPFKRKAKCLSGSNCKNADCKYLHPKTRATMCQLRGKCERWNCQKLHPHTRTRRCPNKEKCTNLECLCLHPQERSNLLCSLGGECREISCKLNHPSERPAICDQPDTCSNFNCTRLHQSQWNPCEEGDDCRDEQCSKIHSSERNLNLQQKNKKNQKTKKINSKSLEQKNKEREKASLPILCRRDDFCQRLEREHVLIVTAETGSGKSTQLPQYAAEHFGSLVVCT